MPDWDDVFKLATPKFVYIRDAKLGLLKFFFMFVIFVYVVVLEILVACTHLPPHVASGFGSIDLKGPVHKCDHHSCVNEYAPLNKLKYCTQYEAGDDEEDEEDGAKKVDSNKTSGAKNNRTNDRRMTEVPEECQPPEVGDFITKKQECRYIDQDRLTLSETPNQIFIPTHYVSYEQKMDPDCYDPMMKNFKGHIPRKAEADYFQCKQGWTTTASKEFFVADIGAYTLVMKHSFVSADLGLAGTSVDYKGFMASCPNNHPKDVKKECKRVAIPNTFGDVAPEDMQGLETAEEEGIESLRGSPEGADMISFKDLLKLTPCAHDHGWTEDIPDRKLPDVFGHPNSSMRESGGMMMLSVGYDNTGPMRPGIPGLPFGAIKPITYTYRPYFLPVKRNKRVEVQMSLDSAEHRVVNIWYGVTVQMSFEGKLVQFAVAELLKAFTTGLVLLSSAAAIVVALATFVLPHKEKYLLQIYQFTEDMSNYKHLAAGESVSSFTGDLLKQVRGKSADGELGLKEITDILVDYEVRLNRIDGRDPKLAYMSDAVEPTDKETATMHKNQQVQTNNWFHARTGGKAGYAGMSAQ